MKLNHIWVFVGRKLWHASIYFVPCFKRRLRLTVSAKLSWFAPLWTFTLGLFDFVKSSSIFSFSCHSQDGSFVVRYSTKKPNFPYTLQLFYKGKIRNLQIGLRDDNKYALGALKEGETVRHSISLLGSHILSVNWNINWLWQTRLVPWINIFTLISKSCDIFHGLFLSPWQPLLCRFTYTTIMHYTHITIAVCWPRLFNRDSPASENSSNIIEHTMSS